jgi:hypothetical protein
MLQKIEGAQYEQSHVYVIKDDAQVRVVRYDGCTLQEATNGEALAGRVGRAMRRYGSGTYVCPFDVGIRAKFWVEEYQRSISLIA